MKKIISLFLKKLFEVFKRIFLMYWRKKNSYLGNIHSNIDSASIVKIPFSSEKAFLRPTKSDVARVSEFINGIYFTKSYLHDSLLQSKPKVLIDIGANIGLSSLSLIKEIPTITKVIAIEAENNNFEILSNNFKIWSKKYKNIEFESIHGIATSSSNQRMTATSNLSEIYSDNTVSGTFRFVIDKNINCDRPNLAKSIGMTDLLEKYSKKDGIIMKIDIEGGEEFLFSENVDWVSLLSFLTIEIHDRYDTSLINSSRSFFKVLSKEDFAVVAEHDVLHCYSRRNLSKI